MKKLGNIIGLVVSLAALVWLVTKYDFGEMLPHVRSASYVYLLPIPAVLMINFLLRAIRWRMLYATGQRAALSDFFSVMMIGNLFNNILPARGGEFVKIYLLGKIAALSKSRILATVIVEKAADLLIAIGLLAVLLLTYPVPEWARKAGLVVAVIALCATAFIVTVGLIGESVARRIALLAGPSPRPLFVRFEHVVRQVSIGFTGLMSPARVVYFIGCSAVIWALEIGVMYAVACAFGLDIGPADLLFIMLMILFGTMVPSSPGYIGTFEFFGLNALAVLGVAGGAALGFIVVLHAILLLGSSLIGVGCLAWRGWPRIVATPDTDTLEGTR
ncbi:MAG: flippase-like domain-containing protein [Burkholderiales bacterium]|nr:flippase-like domain-containing protein [Burkholderiales bacterium]